jgi:hypothetical protein
VTVKSREMAERRERLVSEGATPLEVMLDAMRFFHGEAEKLVERLLTDGAPQGEPADGNAPNQARDIVKAFKEVIGLRQLGGREAARAAPYVHPRMGYDSGQGGDDPDFVPLAERLAGYQRRDELAAAGDNVVELKPPSDQ